MNVVVEDPYNDFHVKIAIHQTPLNKECAQLVYKIERDGTIGIVYIKCNCPSLKGKCTKILLHQMIKYLETREITDDVEVGIFVSPEQPEYGTETFDEKSATSKLTSHYAKYGFVLNDDNDTYMTSTVGKIKQKLVHATSTKFTSNELRILAKISKHIETEKQKQKQKQQGKSGGARLTRKSRRNLRHSKRHITL